MREYMNGWNANRVGIWAALGLACLIAAPSQAWALAGYDTAWSSLYPGSTSLPANTCALCHTADIFTGKNGYGQDLKTQLRSGLNITDSLLAVENLNSDGDPTGATNIEEIDANTQPGWTEGPNNTLYPATYPQSGSPMTGQNPTTGLPGDLDPVPNVPPVADADGPYTGGVGQTIQFNGSGSDDPDGTVVSYDWDFGDGSQGTGMNPTHSYAGEGTFTVTLIVTDNRGDDSDPATTTATIEAVPVNQPPAADAGGPYTGDAGVPVAFDGGNSSDIDGSIVSYDWDFGDGGDGTGPQPTHSYASGGSYTVTLTVTDDGGLTNSATTSVEIAGVQLSPTEELLAFFDASVAEGELKGSGSWFIARIYLRGERNFLVEADAAYQEGQTLDAFWWLWFAYAACDGSSWPFQDMVKGEAAPELAQKIVQAALYEIW